MIYRIYKIVYFETYEAYGITGSYKMVKYLPSAEYLGDFKTKEELKKKFPNTSILLSKSTQISKFEKKLLLKAYRKEKILKLLKNEKGLD